MLELSADEEKLIAVVREIKSKSGFGEVTAVIQDGTIKIVRQTTTIKV